MKKLNYLFFTLFFMLIFCGKVNAQSLADFNNSRYRAYTGNSANGTLIYDSGNGGKQGSYYINIPINNGSVGTPLSIYNIVSANDALQSGIQESFIMSLQLCVSSPINIFNTYAGSSSILRTQNIEYLYSTVSDRITCSVAGTTGYLTTHFIKYDTTTYNVSGDYAFENKFYLYNWYAWGYEINFNVTSIVVESSTAELLNTIEELKQNQTIINSNITLNNSLQQQITQQQNTNNKLDEQIQQDKEQHEETMNTITSSTVDSPNNAFTEFESYLPENGVITQLITLPISLFQKVLSSINGICSQYNLGNLMGTDLILPCINISNYIGTTLWNVIDVLFSGLFVLVISKKMIKAFNNFSSMEEGDVLD